MGWRGWIEAARRNRTVGRPAAESAGEMSDEPWTSVLARGESQSAQGDWEGALQTARTCLSTFPDDRDARSWATFSAFRYLLALRRPDEAAALVSQILQLGTNLATKLHAVCMALDHYEKIGNIEDANVLLRELDACIGRWLAGPVHGDDIAIRSGALVISQGTHLAALAACPHLRFAQLPDDHRVVTSLEAQPRELEQPELCNVVPSQVRRYIDSGFVSGRLSLKTADDITMMRCGTSICSFDAAGNLLPINFSPIPEFYVTALKGWGERAADIIEIPGTSLSMLDEFSHGLNFCHWMLDHLPRALLADRSGERVDHIIGPAPITADFQHESMSALLRDRDYIDIEPGKLYRFERLIYADNFQNNLRHPAYDCHPRIMSLLGEEVAPVDHDDPPLKIYVPRRHGRRVTNETALWGLLSDRGFTRIDTDAMSLSDQVRTFRAATHVIGPHGAALTNLAFCRKGTRVLELFPQFGGSASYYALAAGKELSYSCFTDVPPGLSPVESLETYINDSGIHVDLDFVSHWVAFEPSRTGRDASSETPVVTKVEGETLHDEGTRSDPALGLICDHYGWSYELILRLRTTYGWEPFELVGLVDSQPMPRVDVLNVYRWAHFGNAIYQLSNVVAICKQYGIGRVTYSERPTWFDPRLASEISGIHFSFVPKDQLERFGSVVLSSTFYYGRGFNLNEEDRVDHIRRFVRPMLTSRLADPGPSLDASTACVHFRSGDIFSTLIHNSYGQPPVSFYDFAIDLIGPKRVIVVAQDLSNPATVPFMANCIAKGLPVSFQCSSMEEDVATLLRAHTLVASIGSFCWGITALSQNARRVVYFEKIFDDNEMSLSESQGVVFDKAIDAVGEYRSALLSDNWSNSDRQRSLLVEYPRSNIVLGRSRLAHGVGS